MNENPEISGLAATRLGHIPRTHKQIEKDKVIPLLRSRLNDANIAGLIEDALSFHHTANGTQPSCSSPGPLLWHYLQPACTLHIHCIAFAKGQCPI